MPPSTKPLKSSQQAMHELFLQGLNGRKILTNSQPRVEQVISSMKYQIKDSVASEDNLCASSSTNPDSDNITRSEINLELDEDDSPEITSHDLRVAMQIWDDIRFRTSTRERCANLHDYLTPVEKKFLEALDDMIFRHLARSM